MTTFSWAGRLLPAALARAAALLDLPAPSPTVPRVRNLQRGRSAARDAVVVPAGWEQTDRGDVVEEDALAWLGFESTGHADLPRWSWSRPAGWPTGRGWAA